MKYDDLIVGAGLFGAVFANEMKKRGRKCLVIDKRDHIGGNVYTQEMEGIQVHRYGAHIFHTSDREVWEYLNALVPFNRYTNAPIARYREELFNLPFNMNTFHALWGVKTPAEAVRVLEAQRADALAALSCREPSNLEEQALCLAGRDIYEKLIKGYTEKQWGRPASELPPFIIKRLPLRFTYDNNYFNDKYQGIPEDGYTALIEKLLDGAQVRISTDFFSDREAFLQCADRVLYTGMIDAFYDYCYGELEYRSLRFETEVLATDNYQGNAVVNYTEYEVPYTRIIEHKHFTFGTQDRTVITREYPAEWKKGEEPYYPLNDEKNNALYARYQELADGENHIIFGGRLAEYKYYDMHVVVRRALDLARRLPT